MSPALPRTDLRQVLALLSKGRAAPLLTARFIEQAALGLGSLLLAWRAGIDGYAPISALLVVNSLAVVVSDFGIGLTVLRSEPGAVHSNTVVWARMVNLVVVVAGLLISVAVWGEVGLVVAGGVVVWMVSAEAYIRKSALIKTGRTSRVAAAEIAGSAIFFAFALGAVAWLDAALLLCALGLIGKHLVEAVSCRGWKAAFGSSSEPNGTLGVWASQFLAYSSGNIDFIIVGVLVSAAAFSTYSLAFRLSSVVVSQVAFAVQRLMVVDFSAMESGEALGPSYARYFRMLTTVGVAAGAVTALCAPLAPVFLGEEWSVLVAVLVTLAVAVPWRMTLGVGGTILLTNVSGRQLAGIEAARLVVTTVALGLAAWLSYQAFVGASAIVAIVTCVAFQLIAGRRADIPTAKWLVPAALASAVLAGVTATFITLPV